MKAARAALGEAWDALSFYEAGAGPGGEGGWIKAAPEALGDVILGRKDIETSYHLACVHDDAVQGITHVIRGEDLFFAAHLHVLIQALMCWPRPVYRHHHLLTGPHGKRLAKRDKALTLRALRAAGETPETIRARLIEGGPPDA